MTTPTTPEESGYDTLGWPRDALAVWIEADGPARDAVRQVMPELGMALDREADEVMSPEPRRTRRLRGPGQPRRPVPWEERDEGSGD